MYVCVCGCVGVCKRANRKRNMRQGRRHKQKGEIFEINKQNSEGSLVGVCICVCVCGLGVYRQSFPAGTHQSFIAFAEGLVTSSLVNKMAAVAFPLSCKMAYGARLKVPLTAVACNCLPVCDMTSQLAKHDCVCIYM